MTLLTVPDSAFRDAQPYTPGGLSAPAAPVGTPVGNGLLRFMSNEDLAEQERQKAEALQQQTQIVISNLASHVDRCFQRAKEARQSSGVDQRLLDAQRRRAGEYAPDKLAAIQAIGSVPIWMNLTAEKCAAAEAWISDVLMPADDKPWTLSPTPMPDLPQPVVDQIIETTLIAYQTDVSQGRIPAISTVDSSQQQAILQMLEQTASGMREMHLARLREEAKKRCAAMETKIHDQMVEGGWEEAFDECMTDLITFGTCIMEGPVIEQDSDLAWGPDFEPLVSDVWRYRYRRVSPWLFYPSPESVGVNDGYMTEVCRFTPRDLEGMIGMPHTSEPAIRRVLLNYGTAGYRVHDYNEEQRKALENKAQGYQDSTIDGIKYSGQVSGRMLNEWGAAGIVDPDKWYEACVIKVGTEVVYAKLNRHPLGHRKYAKAVFEKVPGSFWGNGIPHLLRDIQDICNAAARSLCDNMPFAAGPQTVINDVLRLADGEKVGQIVPRRVWQFKNPHDHTSDPIKFQQVESRAQELMAIYERFEAKADLRTRIPAYSYGSDRVAGAGKTSSGLAMLMGNASKGIKKIIKGVDIGLVKPMLENTFVMNMLYDEDSGIKGDVKIVAKGALGLFVKEERTVRLDAMLNKMLHPAIAPILGAGRIVNVLREQAKTIDMPEDEVVPSKFEMQQREQADAQAAAAVPVQQGQPARPGAAMVP